MLKNVDWSTKINVDKQKPHMKSTKDPKNHTSYLYDNVDLQELVNMYADTSELETIMSGKYTNKEIVKINHYIGINVSSGLNGYVEEKNKWAKIHYSAKRTRIVPTLERNN